MYTIHKLHPLESVYLTTGEAERSGRPGDRQTIDDIARPMFVIASPTLCLQARSHPIISLPSNNQFAIKLVKIWPGRTPHVEVETLKISLDRLITPQVENKVMLRKATKVHMYVQYFI